MKRFLLICLVALAAVCEGTAKDGVTRVLAIGNSFSWDSVEQNLHQIAAADSVPMIIGNMYIGGCSIDRHVKNIKENLPDYRYCKILQDGTKTRTGKYTLAEAIKDETWDYVTIQQVSHESGRPQSYGNIQVLVDWVRENAPQAEIIFHQTWAYGPSSKHNGFAYYDRDQKKMYEAVVNTTREQAMKAGVNRFIPCGTAVQNARTTYLGNDLTRDGFHLSYGIGRFIAACTWYETITGRDVTTNTYCPDGSEDGTEAVSPEDCFTARRAAHAAVLCPFEVTPLPEVRSLDGEWELTFWKQPEEPVTCPQKMAGLETKTIPATVPGNVEIDLVAAGLEKDPRIGNNNYLTRKWEGYQWCYSKTFSAPVLEKGKRYEIFFGGIDTVADIWLNGEHLGRVENMLIEHSYDVTDYLVAGENLLQVVIQSSTIYGRRPFLGSISFGHSASPESVNIRKAPHMFGWDILPRVVSAGLWRSVELRTVEPVRFRDVYWMTAEVDVEKRTAEIYADTQFDMPVDFYDGTSVVWTLSRNGKMVYRAQQPCVYHALRQKIHLEDVDFWWPRGYGEPAMYDARCELVAQDGTVLATDTRKLGVRKVKLDFNEINLPENPGRFCFVVNGEPIFIRGTNWVPVDALHSRDVRWMDATVAMVADMNCNMIRCWGGNVYEDHHFFDLCDRYGIMVWQDFTFACNAYPQDEQFGRRIWDETKSVVIKLRRHPSIALWSGNNEIDYSLRRAISCFDPNPNRDNVSRNVIAQVLWEFDPSRPFIPSSPYYTEEVWKRGFIDYEHLPENHLWGPRGYYKTPFYTEAGCVFVSEIGYHGAPDISSLKRMMSPECVYPWVSAKALADGEKDDSYKAPGAVMGGGSSFAAERGAVVNPMDADKNWNEEWLTKSVRRFPELGKTYDRNNLMINQQRLLFGECPDGLEDFVFGSQVVQAEAMKYFVELWRGRKFSPKTGIIWWNIKDGWPDISDAVVDYYLNRKLAYYYIKNVQTDVCCMMNDARNGKYPLVAVNDTPEPVEGDICVTDVASGKKVYSGSFRVEKNGRTDIAFLPEKAGRQGVYLIAYKVNGKECRNHYLYGKAPFKLSEYREWMEKTGIYDLNVD